MTKTTELLDVRRTLLAETVDWLLARMRSVCGAASLAHLAVVVPTAQSGRQLRLALAQAAAQRGLGGILPPQVRQPMDLIVPADGSLRTADDIELRAAFLKFVANRPNRVVSSDGKVALLEWTHLFQPEFIADYRAHLAFFDQLADIWRILAGNGLLMRDVPQDLRAVEVLEAAVGDEHVRWQELASFETAFFDFLHGRGLRSEFEGIQLAKRAARPLPSEVEAVVLPGLLDPVAVLYDVLAQQPDTLSVYVLTQVASGDELAKYDGWGRPQTEQWTGRARPVLDRLADADVVRTVTDTELARLVVADFPPEPAEAKRPSLGLCDAELYPELAAAFLNAGYRLHNPERQRIAVSSLGRLLVNLVDLYAARRGDLPWAAFAALMREDDVLKVLSGRPEQPKRPLVLEGLDVCQNTFLLEVLPSDLSFAVARLREHDLAAFEAFRQAAADWLAHLRNAWRNGASASVFLRRMLEGLFSVRALTGGEGERELRAAAEAVRAALDCFDGSDVATLALNERAFLGLMRKTLSEVAYSLESESRDTLKTEGWLELAWSPSDKIALVGFSEGAVPDSVVGHPFVPDALRSALGLTANDRRMARDTVQLRNLLAARPLGSVRAYLAQANNAGDLRRPSRLLFLVDDAHLTNRMRTLFGVLGAGNVRDSLKLEDGWRPRLPMAPLPLPHTDAQYPNGRLSVSALDAWLVCPFSYLLQYGLFMQRVQVKEELGADDFGTLIHRALELYAREQLDRTRRGLAQLHEESDIADALVRALDDCRRNYGRKLSVRLRLQFDSAAGRLRNFARIQSFWAQDGWAVAAEPEYAFEARPFAGEGGDVDVPFRGSVDRIDYKPGVGYRLIDYKTWDRKDGAARRILKGGDEQVAHAAALRLPVVEAGSQKAPSRLLTVQLPLYARCLEVSDGARFGGQVADCCYVLLGKDVENTVVLGSSQDQGAFAGQKKNPILRLLEHRDLALDTARVALRRLRAGIYWPPGPDRRWQYDLKDVLLSSPERDFPSGTAWRDAQEARLAALGKASENPREEQA